MNVRRSASGEKPSCCCSSRRSRNASIGVRTRSWCLTLRNLRVLNRCERPELTSSSAGRTRRRGSSRVLDAKSLRPTAIHLRIATNSSGVSLVSPGGMSSDDVRSSSGLSSGLPSTSAGPLSPPDENQPPQSQVQTAVDLFPFAMALQAMGLQDRAHIPFERHLNRSRLICRLAEEPRRVRPKAIASMKWSRMTSSCRMS